MLKVHMRLSNVLYTLPILLNCRNDIIMVDSMQTYMAIREWL